MRKRSVKDKKYFDENIVGALKSLSLPLKTFDNHDVEFNKDKRYETLFQHISNQKHRFKVNDIKEIPKILKDRKSLQNDEKKKVFRNYVGDRPKKNAKLKYIKIITRIMKGNKEEIETIYLIKNKSIAKKK